MHIRLWQRIITLWIRLSGWLSRRWARLHTLAKPCRPVAAVDRFAGSLCGCGFRGDEQATVASTACFEQTGQTCFAGHYLLAGNRIHGPPACRRSQKYASSFAGRIFGSGLFYLGSCQQEGKRLDPGIKISVLHLSYSILASVTRKTIATIRAL